MANAKILIVQNDHSAAIHLEERLKGTAFHLHPRIKARFAPAHLEERLIDLGYTVCATVSSGQQAIEKAAETHPDLALIALELKGEISSIEVAEQIGSEIPVIYLVDDAGEDLLQRAEATQPYGYVLKPIEERQLHLNIKTALSLSNRDKHRETERESEHRTQLLENIFESIEDGIVAIDEKGKYLIFNQSAKNMFGTPDPDLSLDQRSEYYGFFFEDRATSFPDAELPLSRAALNGESSDSEIFVHNSKMADDIIVGVRATPIRCAEGRLQGGVVVCREITANKEAKAKMEQSISELRDQNQLMETVIDNIDEGVILSDAADHVWFTNTCARQIFGIDAGEKIGNIAPGDRSKKFGVFHLNEKSHVLPEHFPLVRVLKGEDVNETFYIRNKNHPEGKYVGIRGQALRHPASNKIRSGMIIARLLGEEREAIASLAQTVGKQRGETVTNGDIARDLSYKEMESELTRIIDELRDQIQFLEDTCNTIDEGIIVSDLNGQILFANSTTERIFGKWIINPDMADWSKTYGIFYPDIKTSVPIEQLPLTRAIMGEETDEMEFFIRNEKKPEGTYISARGRPIRNRETSEIIAGLAVFRDLTKIKETDVKLGQTIKELRDQNELMETIFNSISDGIVVADEAGNFLYVNPAAEHIVGMGPLDIPPNEWSQTYGSFYPDQKTPIKTEDLPLSRAIFNGESSNEEDIFIRNEKKPEGVYIRVSGRPLLNEIGGIRGGVIAFHDITARKIAEDKLRETINNLRNQNELMETLFNTISDGMIVTDLVDESVQINPSAIQMTGIDELESPITRWTEKHGVFYADQKTPMRARDLPLFRIISRGELIDDEDLFIKNKKKPDGVYIRISGRPLLNKAGEIRGGVLFFRDITQQMIAEEALAQAFAQGRLEIMDTILHNIGNAITSITTGIETIHRNLADDPLVHRLSALANAVKARRENWIDYISNDPQGQQVLSFIIALADDFAHQQADWIRTVDRVKDRATHIADIVRTQRTRSTSAITLRKDIDLQQALSDAARVLQDSFDKRNIALEIDCKNAPREIRIQESQFHQMMVNLIKNAIEAIDDLAAEGTLTEPPRIQIRACIKADFFHLDVTDNGIGIEQKNLKILFSAGYTTKKFGTGLGLHSAANFVIGSGGQIRALSDGIGKGATIRITLRHSSIIFSQEQIGGSTKNVVK